MPKDSIHIVLADSQYLSRAGYLYLFAGQPHLQVVGEALDMEELLHLVQETAVQLVITDYHNGGLFSLEDILKLRQQRPDVNVLVVTDDQNRDNISQLLNAGISCILTKNCSQEEILSAAAACAKKEKFFCNKVLDIILEKHVPKQEESCDPSNLSAREVEIVALVAQGKSTKEIADLLCLSTHTIYTHRKNIMKKLRINSASEMILYAMESGIVKR
jgi:DNA-binding NarL/FixJ family response regulator